MDTEVAFMKFWQNNGGNVQQGSSSVHILLILAQVPVLLQLKRAPTAQEMLNTIY